MGTSSWRCPLRHLRVWWRRKMLPSRALRLAAQQGLRASQPALSTSAARSSVDVQLTQAQKDKWYPKVGNRDIVGWGFNGSHSYVDKEEDPCRSRHNKQSMTNS